MGASRVIKAAASVRSGPLFIWPSAMNNDTGIYTITSPSGNCYVGSATSFKRRWNKHRQDLRAGKHHSVALQRAYDKYGESALKFEKVALFPITDLIVIEQSFIDRLKPKYNCCPKAGSTLGIKLGPLSEEHRRKIGDGHRGKKMTESQREALARALHGRKMPDAWKRKTAERMTGEGNHFFGKKHDAETLAKITGDNHHSSRAVICIETGMRFSSITAAAMWLRENGWPSASRSPIWSCCHMSTRYKRPYGYTWRFEGDVGMLQKAA